MGLLDRFRGGGDIGESIRTPVIVPDYPLRRGQLLQLETAILDVMDEMERSPHWRNPGWQELVKEFYTILGTIRHLRTREFAWSDLVDMAFEVRPVMRMNPVPEGLEHLGELQDRMMRLANALSHPTPTEVQG